MALDEDEWEYEYSSTETETFYVDLDLSSVNGVIKSQNAGDRKTLNKPGKQKSGHVVQDDADETQIQDADDNNNNDQDEPEEDREAGEVRDIGSPSKPQSPPQRGMLDEDYTDRVQILDFNTINPIVSYNGHFYSCTWHDMLGTSMFISKHQEAPFHEPDISTEDYDLIGMSRIKLVGHRARIVPKAGSKKRRREESEEEAVADDLDTAVKDPAMEFRPYVPDGRSLGTITRTNPRVNIEIKQQANFLERLMEAKKSRGETDTVRTFVDRRTVAADAKQARKTQKEAKARQKEKEETAEQRMRREINELNKRVVKGDNEALERLQEIYADMEEVEDEEDRVLIGNSIASAPALVAIRASTEHADNPRVSEDEGGNTERAPHVADSDPNGATG